MSNYIIVGCGRVGSKLADRLSKEVNNICVIDIDETNFSHLGTNFNGSTVLGLGYDEDVLKTAGIEVCDTLLAVTSYDNINLMTCEVAKRIFNVKKIISRLHNPDFERPYMQLGIQYVCGTNLVAEQIYDRTKSEVGFEFLQFGNYSLLKFCLDLSSTDSMHIKCSDLEYEHSIKIVAYERADGSLISIPVNDTILYSGDTIIACVGKDVMPEFKKYILN